MRAILALALTALSSLPMLAQQGPPPKIISGNWKFTMGGWSAQLQLQQTSATSVIGTFITGSGATFPGFTATVNTAPGRTYDLSLTWDPANRDVPGLLPDPVECGALVPRCTEPPTYTAVVGPDGGTMVGWYTHFGVPNRPYPCQMDTLTPLHQTLVHQLLGWTVPRSHPSRILRSSTPLLRNPRRGSTWSRVLVHLTA
jgi:hypothetical protein